MTIVGTTDSAALRVVADFGAGPMLFSGHDSLDPRVAVEITRVLGSKTDPSQHLEVQIVGGTALISAAVEHKLTTKSSTWNS